jgi:hypothetical protein
MSAQLRHQLTQEGVVLVTITRPNLPPVCAHMQPEMLRRFAWGVLNDLDPDEAEFVKWGPDPICRREGAALVDAKRRVLEALAAGRTNSVNIARLIKTDPNRVSVSLCQLRLKGLTDRVRSPVGRGFIWSITEKGECELERLRELDGGAAA